MLDIIIPLLETFDETGEFILHYAAFALGYFTQFQFLTADFGNFQYLFEKLHDMGVINSDLLNSIYIPKYCIDTNTEIEDAIIHDDADKLIKLHSENTRIDVKNLETFDFKESNRLNKPKRLIDCAAFYGASKCFNFLLLSGAGLTKNLMRNAIHDQNVDIIHKVDDEIASFPRTRYNISETKIMEMKKSLLFLFGYRKHRCSFTCQ
ncbi:hypothetical protein TRFO_15467 [Tritrichomonas foetus]|uniref:DUF3447 domain-containing protein n=1 Tax=Tritrichomonas foetus TaxID=1144522 RepID=A0A1J4KX52_9EUKA|nr:hypothetical protein TRFO_15467 [Tritrichomonas foetus]|eukprot:OHT14286.1 hypothetical protein TRFO_15467 [Tritrichomonas foetus]